MYFSRFIKFSVSFLTDLSVICDSITYFFSFLWTFILKPKDSEYFFFRSTILDFSSLISSGSRFRSHFFTAINTLFASSRVRQNTLKSSAYITKNIPFNLVFLSQWYLTFPSILPSDFNTFYECLVGISSHWLASHQSSSFSTIFASNGNKMPPYKVSFMGYIFSPLCRIIWTFNISLIMQISFLSRSLMRHICFISFVWFTLSKRALISTSITKCKRYLCTILMASAIACSVLLFGLKPWFLSWNFVSQIGSLEPARYIVARFYPTLLEFLMALAFLLTLEFQFVLRFFTISKFLSLFSCLIVVKTLFHLD